MTLPHLAGARVLVYGIGNTGRQDDGLGVRLVEQLEGMRLPATVTLETNYQLAPEDALALSAHDVVIFVDATVDPDAPAPYALAAVAPVADRAFSSHVLGRGTLLELCHRLYGRGPRAYAMAIPAYAFEVNAELSPGAADNLARSLDDLRRLLSGSADPSAG